jgi:hypothetical protein
VVQRVPLNPSGGPTGQFVRPGGARFEPGSSTHKILPNRNAQVTVEVGPPVMPIPSVHSRHGAGEIISAGNPGGEIVLGTDVVVQPRTNAEWIDSLNDSEHGRHSDDQYSGVSVPAWYPTYPMGVGPEDRS